MGVSAFGKITLFQKNYHFLIMRRYPKIGDRSNPYKSRVVQKLTLTGVLVHPYARGNGEWTVEYLNDLIRQLPDVQIVMILDGAPYHRSGLVKTFLASVNHGLESEDWRVTCLQFAPNDPTQNPIEDIWLQAKRWLRECYHQCKDFAAVKTIFELAIEGRIFDFPKLNRLGEFSLIS
jgi:transposase